MTNVNWKDVLIRSVKTFVETAVAFLLAELAGAEIFVMDKGVWLSVGVSAAAAGAAAVWNGVIEPMMKLPDK